jgi:hypothetical protein
VEKSAYPRSSAFHPRLNPRTRVRPPFVSFESREVNETGIRPCEINKKCWSFTECVPSGIMRLNFSRKVHHVSACVQQNRLSRYGARCAGVLESA